MQLGVLIRHFFIRFFRNPRISQDGDLSITLVELVAPLAAIGGLTCLLTLQHKFFLSFIGERVDPSFLWVNESFYVSLAMILTTLVTVLEWDELLLDEGDFSNLAVLPIRLDTLFLAKVASLLLFVGLISVGANAFSALLFPALMSPGGGFTHQLWWMMIHSGVLFVACLSVFCFCLAFQGLLAPAPWQRRLPFVSLGFRWALLVVSFTGLAALPRIHAALPALKDNEDFVLWCFPPMWFVGIHQQLWGVRDPVFESLAEIAVLISLGGLMVVGAVYAVQYRRLTSRSGEGRGMAAGLSRSTRAPGRLIRAFLRDSVERAVFFFIGQTLFRRQKQLLVWAGFSGLAVALVAVSYAQLVDGLESPSRHGLSLLHLLVFFSVVGLRVVFGLPANLEANWIFKLTIKDDPRGGLGAVKKATFVFGVLPYLTLALAFHVSAWGWVAAAHCLYASTLAVILIEILFFGFRKIPFAHVFSPENANLKLMLPFYVAGFTCYVYGGAFLEAWLLQTPARFAAGQVLLGGAVISWPWLRRRFLDGGPESVVFQQQRQAVTIRIQLN